MIKIIIPFMLVLCACSTAPLKNSRLEELPSKYTYLGSGLVGDDTLVEYVRDENKGYIITANDSKDWKINGVGKIDGWNENLLIIDNCRLKDHEDEKDKRRIDVWVTGEKIMDIWMVDIPSGDLTRLKPNQINCEGINADGGIDYVSDPMSEPGYIE